MNYKLHGSYVYEGAVVPITRQFRHAGAELVAPRLAVGAARLLAPLSPVVIRRTLSVLRHGAIPAAYPTAAEAHAAVMRVSPRIATKSACLPRSIGTVLLCRLRGQWPTWVVGVAADPFRAHAWVEADGRLVGEGSEERRYAPVICVAPRELPQ